MQRHGELMIVRSIHKPDAAPGGAKKLAVVRVCRVPGCAREIARSYFLCQQHWLELPAEIRDEVAGAWAAWMSGRDDVRPYMTAQLKAVVYVTKLHGMAATVEEAELARWTPAKGDA